MVFRKNLLPEEEGGLSEEPTSGKNSGSSSGSSLSSSGSFPERRLSEFFLEVGSSKIRNRRRIISPIHCLLGVPAILLGARSISHLTIVVPNKSP